MTKIVLIIFSFTLTSILFADECKVAKINSCTKAKISDQEIDLFKTITRFSKVCTVTIEYVDSKETQKNISVQPCPDLDKDKVYNIYTQGKCGHLNYLDKLLVISDEDCDKILSSRSNAMIELNKIKKGTLMSQLQVYGLEQVTRVGDIWHYSYKHGLVVKIKVTGEKCDDRLCIEPSLQKFDHVDGLIDYRVNAENL